MVNGLIASCSVTGSNSFPTGGSAIASGTPDYSVESCVSGTYPNISSGTFSDPYQSKLQKAFICSLMTRSISPVTPHGGGGTKKKKVRGDLFRTPVT